jgi:hypothetical protein
VRERKNILLRLDPAVHDALARWAGDDLRSTTAQIEMLLRQALSQAGRLPRDVGDLPRRGRPPKSTQDEGESESENAREQARTQAQPQPAQESGNQDPEPALGRSER